jgi:hypothetical protein
MDEKSLKARYDRLVPLRQPFLDRAREASVLTLPYLIPPEGTNASFRLPTPYQSTGARGVNTLAAKLLETLLPPNTPQFRLTIHDFTVEKLTEREGMRAEVEKALNKIERAVGTEIEATAVRTPSFTALKHLLVSGNGLLYMPNQGGMKFFPLTSFVIKRDPMGTVLEIITKEMISPMALPEEIRSLVQLKDQADGKKDDPDSNKELYTSIVRKGEQWEVTQEVQGIPIPESRGTYPIDKSAWIPLRFTVIDGEDYGRGFVEEYMGDLISLEGLTKAIVQASAAAAKVLFLVRPNGMTKAKTLATAESGDIKDGVATDVTVLQMEKYNDFRVALESIQKIEERLSYAFMLSSAIQRSGDRVTAEEIRYMAQDLESNLGGIYSTLSQDYQLPLVNRLMHRMEKQGKLPSLPKGIVRPAIITGVEAIGRGNDLVKLQTFFEQVAVVAQLPPEVDKADAISRVGTALGIDMAGLIKSAEKLEEEQNQAQMMAMAQAAVPNAVNQVGNMAQSAMAGQAAPQ